MIATEIRQILKGMKDKPKVYKKTASKLLRGALYLFRYSNPKYKKTLDYYDARPLILLLEYNSTHLLGISLHYIPWTYRINFVKKVIKRLSYKNRIKYTDIKRAADAVRMPEVYAYFAVKKYIRSRIGSDLYCFSFDNWREATANIPSNFKKAQDTRVLKDIHQKVKDLRKAKKKAKKK